MGRERVIVPDGAIAQEATTYGRKKTDRPTDLSIDYQSVKSIKRLTNIFQA